jgi:hypothetical protein
MAVVDPLVVVVVVVKVALDAVLAVGLLDPRKHSVHTMFATNVEVRRRDVDEMFALYFSSFRSWPLRI